MNYRLVIFPVVMNGNLFVYPDDRKLFKNAKPNDSGSMVAFYKGALSLPVYSGEWPAPNPVTYKTVMTPTEFIDLIPDATWKLLRASTLAKVRKAMDQIMSATTVDVNGKVESRLLTMLHSNGKLTDDELADIKRGTEV